MVHTSQRGVDGVVLVPRIVVLALVLAPNADCLERITAGGVLYAWSDLGHHCYGGAVLTGVSRALFSVVSVSAGVRGRAPRTQKLRPFLFPSHRPAPLSVENLQLPRGFSSKLLSLE